ncbi:MAG: HEPN domain-containing protein [Elusimicrobia bacterium]|nr:HEPN domain-containing protein [Elusimicrobiota bacterium]
MKDSKQNANRWIKEADYTLCQAKGNYRQKYYNLTCFLAEQASQKALKAALYFDGARFVNIHSIRELIKEVSKKHPKLLEIIGQGTKLDHYYLSTRYPDAVPEPAIPVEIFLKEHADEAIKIAEKIFKSCEKIII